jgi:hypothetical protein
MIRFGVIVTVVVAAVGLLAVGAVDGDLTLVYVSIALAAVALLLLIVGVAVWRDEVFASSARRDERDLAAVGAVGHEGWPDRPGARPGPAPGAEPGLQGGDTREFSISVGALPDRDAPADRDRRSGESRQTEQLPRPADPAARPGREVRHREPARQEAGTEEWPGRDLPAPDFSGREAAAAGWPGRDLAAAGRPGRDAAPPDRPGRDAAPGDRPAREAPDRAGREKLSAHRPDRADQYPTVIAPDRYESADDPTRLAHRLDSLADLGRQADPEAPGPTRSRAGRPGGPRLPAAAPIDPLPGAVSDRASAAEPVAAAPSTGRAAARPPGTEQGPGVEADASQPPTVSVTPVTGAPGGTAPGTPKGLGSRSSVPPAEAATVAGLVFPAPPAQTPAARDEDAATVTRAAAAPPATSSVPSATAADTVGTAAASQPDASTDTTGAAEQATVATAATDGGAAAGPAIGLDDQVSVVPGIARYHKADCILIRFLSEDDLEVMSRRDAQEGGCAPCRACRPDQPPASD